MNNKSDWLDGIKRQITLLKDTLSEKDYKKYKLPLMLCLAERVTQFYDECGQCQILQQDISALTQDVGNLTQLADKERQKSYFKSIDKITNHLQKQHKLVNEGYYMGIGIAIGSGIGVALGVALEQIGGGIPIGVGIGLAIGAALDAKAKKEGRILCPKETKTTTSMNFKILAIVLGLLVAAGLAAFFFFQQMD
ncbi:hypothetical protein ACFLUS_02915 [Chloroflexota bacterium]